MTVSFRDASPLNGPDHWRKNAADLRLLAESAPNDIRGSLLKVAAEYDLLAEQANSRLAEKKPG